MNFKVIRINDYDPSRILAYPDKTSLLIDLRSPGDFQTGHLPGAINLPYEQWEDNPDRLLLYRRYLLYLYCEYGNISLMASRILSESGFHTVNLYGGIHAYRGPLESSAAKSGASS